MSSKGAWAASACPPGQHRRDGSSARAQGSPTAPGRLRGRRARAAPHSCAAAALPTFPVALAAPYGQPVKQTTAGGESVKPPWGVQPYPPQYPRQQWAPALPAAVPPAPAPGQVPQAKHELGPAGAQPARRDRRWQVPAVRAARLGERRRTQLGTAGCRGCQALCCLGGDCCGWQPDREGPSEGQKRCMNSTTGSAPLRCPPPRFHCC